MSAPIAKVLVVDDELSMREYLEVLLAKAGYAVATASSVKEAKEALGSDRPDLVISDMKLGNDTGIEVLKAARALASPPEVILITAYGSAAAAVEAMREGAYDYIAKPFDNEELRLLVGKALEKRNLVRENKELKRTLGPGSGRFLVGGSAGMRAVWSLVERVAASKTTVLITGESGTGKELIARGVHWKSTRSNQPFMPVNCAALAAGVLESELFGHVKGSFTGATSDRSGILVSAGEGTVFLDEIGEVPPATQVKLLRVLQEKRVKPVGSSQEVPFQARIVAATNKRLETEVKAGRFREDLFYRLNVITIEIPPLRERREDIPALADHFLEEVARELGRPTLRFSPRTLDVLKQYDFPGNVRQLQNIVERAATLSEGEVLMPDSLPPTLRGEAPAPLAFGEAGAAEAQLTQGFSLERYLDDAERRYLTAALQKADGVKTRAAEILGLSFRSFRYRLAKHGLTDREEGDGGGQGAPPGDGGTRLS